MSTTNGLGIGTGREEGKPNQTQTPTFALQFARRITEGFVFCVMIFKVLVGILCQNYAEVALVYFLPRQNGLQKAKLGKEGTPMLVEGEQATRPKRKKGELGKESFPSPASRGRIDL